MFMQFQGTYTALVTPFRDDRVDDAALVRLVEEQIAGGVDGVVAVGTTGESPTLTHEEHIGVIRRTVEIAAKRTTVIAGTGSNSTREAIDLSQSAEEVGADAILLVAPYYNKPSQEGLFRHFQAIANATRLPVILYSIPGRCGVEIGIETTARLAAACQNIVAMKEAGGSVERVSQLRAKLPEFTVLSGDDSLTLPFLSVGAMGVISVASNLIPGEAAKLVRSYLDGNTATAAALHAKYYPLFKDLFIEPNPVPIKTALARRGWMTDDVRPPLCEMGDAARAKLMETLNSLGL
jgi:4-hydroxy-tetrahydrodipicolinate synthase